MLRQGFLSDRGLCTSQSLLPSEPFLLSQMQTPENLKLLKENLVQISKNYFGLNVAVTSDVQKVENGSNEPGGESSVVMILVIIIMMKIVMMIYFCKSWNIVNR